MTLSSVSQRDSAGRPFEWQTDLVAGATHRLAVAAIPTTYADTTTPLAASTNFTGTSRDQSTGHSNQWFAASAFSNVAGTLVIEMSNNNTDWFRAGQVNVGVREGQSLTVPAVARYYRVVFINGAAAQTSFSVNSAYLAF